MTNTLGPVASTLILGVPVVGSVGLAYSEQLLQRYRRRTRRKIRRSRRTGGRR